VKELLTKRFLRFSLPTFFIAISVLCVWLGYRTHRARMQRELVAWVGETGGFVHFDWQINAAGKFDPKLTHPVPEWLRRRAGDEFFQNIVYIAVGEPTLSDLSPLSKARGVEELYIASERIDDFTPLLRLPRLRRLELSVETIGDPETLADLFSLDQLSLSANSVSDAEVNSLRKALPDCDVIVRGASIEEVRPAGASGPVFMTR
jgi:hypothetical protein